jgi:excisionase family DNA binding protein
MGQYPHPGAGRKGADSDWVTVAEAAARTKYSPTQLRRLLREGRLEGKRFGRDWVLSLASVEAYQRTDPRPGRPPGRRPAS